MEDVVRVHVAEDHYITLMGYKALLSQFNCEIVSVSKNGLETIKWAESNKEEADVLLLDISMKLLNGLEAFQYMQKQNINIPTVVFTSHLDESLIKIAFDCGALSYVCKSDPTFNMPKAVLAAAKGEKFIPDYVQEIIDKSNLFKPRASKIMNFSKPLSPNELKTLELIVEEKDTSEIVQELKISKSSFYTVIERIREKANVKNNIALVKKLFRNNY
ncbi:conserved protein of unknown function [Tenacibaculum sp. 190524A02b]|uniref:response regulator transcription factor n=1 Tax=Tenacibaculum vairaonense TaxID=3137860 RepID=UPI0032B2E483